MISRKKCWITAFVSALGLIAISITNGQLANAADSPPDRVMNSRAEYVLGACQTATELDCIEDFGSIDASSGQRIKIPATQSSYDANQASTDDMENPVIGTASEWQLNLGDRSLQATVDIRLAGTRHRFEDATKRPHDGETAYFEGGGLNAFIRLPEPDYETEFYLVLRTSWFRPDNVTIQANQATFETQKLNGGNRWQYSGRFARIAYYNFDSLAQFEERNRSGAIADRELDSWAIFSGHWESRPRPKIFWDRCGGAGLMVQSSNAAGGGKPEWISGTRSLNFSIDAAHRTLDGKLNRGFYRMWVNKDYVRCMWPTSGLDKAKSFTIGVYNEDGEKQVATTLVATKGDLFTVAAYNFHYSAPTIRVSGSKKKILTCVGVAGESQVKKFKSKKICPDGYKRFG